MRLIEDQAIEESALPPERVIAAVDTMTVPLWAPDRRKPFSANVAVPPGEEVNTPPPPPPSDPPLPLLIKTPPNPNPTPYSLPLLPTPTP